MQEEDQWLAITIKQKDGTLITRIKGDYEQRQVAEDFYNQAKIFGFDATDLHIIKLKQQLELKFTLNQIGDLLKRLAKE